MKINLQGKVIVLTGASRGIGAKIAEDLGRQGAHLVLAARDIQNLQKVALTVEAVGGKASLVACDVSKASDRTQLLEKAMEQGPIDVLINNAGIEDPVAVLDLLPEEVEAQITVNLQAPIELTRLVLPQMIERHEGCIVNISSMSGKTATPYNAIYAATKHGLNGFTSSLRIELKGSGVNAGVVCPSFVDAGMWADSGASAPALMKVVSAAAVVKGVQKVMEGKGEVLVTPSPVRPLLALGQLMPFLEPAVMNWMGVTAALRERAQIAVKRRKKD
mmetsp:Transcript_15021/g.36063  ORF Transcript_15021/g.36063 Transcript_15021/m.36063 type:complete len:275 (+) Transcript_15021:134-958(+)